MLGIIRSKRAWKWTACGKHPVAKDYFMMKTDDPLLKALANWMENGYKSLGPKRDHSQGIYAWRFWAKGPKKESLVCGFVRDSSDFTGRPYPLLVMGAGYLKGWSAHWNLLPYACENVWNQMDYLAARRFMDLGQLEDSVRIIQSPLSDWNDAAYAQSKTVVSLNYKKIEGKAAGFAKKAECFIPLDSGTGNVIGESEKWHTALKAHTQNIPNAMFWGGASGKLCLAVFNRKLTISDFGRLWSEL